MEDRIEIRIDLFSSHNKQAKSRFKCYKKLQYRNFSDRLEAQTEVPVSE